MSTIVEESGCKITNIAKCAVAIVAILGGLYVLINGFHYVACAGCFIIALACIPDANISTIKV